MKDSLTTQKAIVETNRNKNDIPHIKLLEAAKEERLLTTYLFTKAVETVIHERNEQEVDNYELLILQQRVNEEVIHQSYTYLESADVVCRHVACKILRELGGLNNAPHLHSEKSVYQLEKLLQSEEDIEVIVCALSAIGWQCHPVSKSILLKWKNDLRDEVRYIVAMNLFNVCVKHEKMPKDIAETFIAFAKDKDPDIRLSVFYDMAEYPELFKEYQSDFLKVIIEAEIEVDIDVKKEIQRAHHSLMSMTSNRSK